MPRGIMCLQCTAEVDEMRNIENRVALVTGAGSGIGKATALGLAEAGARVAVSDINAETAGATANEICERGGNAASFRLDVANPGSIEQAAELIREEMGVPGILVNNAGIAVAGHFLDSSPEGWDRVLAVNLLGVISCCRAFVPAMVASGQPGHVVNIASMLGFFGVRGASAYCTTKFGVVGFSECLRAELHDQQIGVSTICPGVIRTNIIREGILESVEDDEEEKRAQINDLFERRNYPPERVAAAVIKAVRKNRGLVPVSPEARMAWYLKRFVPGLFGRLVRRDLV
jgi:NAD(P)-dependent dehydrogenase (short-subunit alcohol dehydrogenase family)